jgi:hypothetical protein
MPRRMYRILKYTFQKLSVFQHPFPLYTNISLGYIVLVLPILGGGRGLYSVETLLDCDVSRVQCTPLSHIRYRFSFHPPNTFPPPPPHTFHRRSAD